MDAPVGDLPKSRFDLYLVDFPTPAELSHLHSLPEFDAAIRSLATHSHPQQRRNLLHSHKRKLAEFIEDTNLQWDGHRYVNQRYNPSRHPQSLFATPEILQNIKLSKPEGGDDVPIQPNDKMSINELQLQLSNQAALLRMAMTTEYVELRNFQNSELDALIKAKAAKNPEFSKLVEEAKKHGPVPFPPVRTVPVPKHRPSDTDTTPIRSPRISKSPMMPFYDVSPQTMSPEDVSDISLLRNDTSFPPFVRFFLHLKVVQQSWPVISKSWSQYVTMFQRNLITEQAFAKAILEDAVRASNRHATKFPVDEELLSNTRELAKNINDRTHIAKIITNVVLEMAEAGVIEFIGDPNETKNEAFGPKILLDVMSLEITLQAQQQAPQQARPPEIPSNVKKASDPRQKT